MYIEIILQQKLHIDDICNAKTAKKRKFIVRSTCFDTIMSEKSTVSGKSSRFHILDHLFRLEHQTSPRASITATILKPSVTMDPLYPTDTSSFELVCYHLSRFWSFPDFQHSTKPSKSRPSTFN